MAKQTITIRDIFGGLMPSALYGEEGQYQASIGIDPDMPLTDSASDVKAGGAIRPVNYAAFSGANVTSYPIAIITVPQTTNVYVVLANGRLISYSSALTSASESLIGTVTGGVANGAWYYNNYIYITTGTDVSRYGPLDGAAALMNTVWTGATLGSLTALANTTYPNSLLSTPYLNHFGVAHVDNASYFLDYVNGQGKVHKIKTTKVTNEGDTNNGSAYGVLSLPLNYLPVSICRFGNDMVVSGSFTKDSTILQGKSALFFFNPADTVPSFYRIVDLPDALCSGLIYINGNLYGIAGDINGGYRLFHYLGADSVETVKFIEEGNLPLQCAMGSIGEKIVWAADNTYPMVASGLYGYGSKSGLFARGLHHIALSGFTS
jgi:hypothetical protein